MSDSKDNVKTTKQAYSQIHQQYIDTNSTLNDDIKRNLDHFLSMLSGESVLDVGCAGGRESEYMDSHGLAVTGCDLSEEFVAEAQKRCSNCTFFVADMRKLGNLTAAYDGLWVNASFLHVPKSDALATLQGFHDLLKDNGILYLSVMCGSFDGLRENKGMNWPARHFSDYSPEELQALLAQAGFKLVGNDSADTDWGPTFLHYFCKKN